MSSNDGAKGRDVVLGKVSCGVDYCEQLRTGYISYREKTIWFNEDALSITAPVDPGLGEPTSYSGNRSR